MNNSMIAKLLAKENITVEHGNFRTAFFDVEKRILGLPLWKDMGKNVHDLLVGHEVGHALFTPADGWHDSTTTIPGCPRAYINIVEDIRIEKLIQRQYPGLVGSFKRGYETLDQQDFFGIEGKHTGSLHLADRINLKAKLRTLVNVEFSAKEKSVVDQCFAVETWDDVLEACRALYNFIEETKNAQDEDISSPSEDFADQNEDNSEDLGVDSDASDQDDGESTDQPGNTPSSQESGHPSDDDQDQGEPEESSDLAGSSRDQIDPHTSVTDSAFRDNENSLLDINKYGQQRQVVKAITRSQTQEMVNSYDAVSGKRKQYNKIYDLPAFNAELTEFNEETKKFVAVMSKEFEMRKMAYRTKRAQTSRSGSLNMSQLHTYKYNDDIFSKVTRLADAKSHGMVMFIDFSGSMHPVLADTIRQTMILASFCKKVHIPFEVYSFTSGDPIEKRTRNTSIVAQFDHDGTMINTLLTSDMSKSVYEKAYRELFMVTSKRSYCTTWDGLGGTPLNETLMAARFILADFKARTNVQKVNAVFLTDGDAQSMYVDNMYLEDQLDNTMRTAGTTIMIDGKRIDSHRFGNQREVTKALLDELRKKYTVIGYYLAPRPYDVRGKIWQIDDRRVPDEEMKAYMKEYRSNKFVSFDNALGYDKFFIIKADRGALDTSDDEFEVSENAKKGEIQRAFKKHANSKKTNKLFATQFAKMVA